MTLLISLKVEDLAVLGDLPEVVSHRLSGLFRLEALRGIIVDHVVLLVTESLEELSRGLSMSSWKLRWESSEQPAGNIAMERHHQGDYLFEGIRTVVFGRIQFGLCGVETIAG